MSVKEFTEPKLLPATHLLRLFAQSNDFPLSLAYLSSTKKAVKSLPQFLLQGGYKAALYLKIRGKTIHNGGHESPNALAFTTARSVSSAHVRTRRKAPYLWWRQEASSASSAILRGSQEGVGAMETVPMISTTVSTEMKTPKEIQRRPKGNPKLESSLNGLVAAYRQGGNAEAQTFAMRHNMVLRDGGVQVTIVTSPGAMEDVLCAVQALGGEYQTHYRHLLQILVPIVAPELLAQRPDVQIIRELRKALLQ